MIKTYEKYLELINDNLIQKCFDNQKEYIKCQPGCSFCCEEGEYPFTQLEFEYAMIGYNNLKEEEKEFIQSKIKKIKKQKEKSTKKEFMYECPFLINKKCSIYNHRGIICRIHGLMYYIKDENGETKNKGPKCIGKGLNYSSVYDESQKLISPQMWKKTGIKTEPEAYNIGLKFLINNKMTKELNLEFGEIKALIDWFE